MDYKFLLFGVLIGGAAAYFRTQPRISQAMWKLEDPHWETLAVLMGLASAIIGVVLDYKRKYKDK